MTEGRVAGESAATSMSPVRPGTVARDVGGVGVAREEGDGGGGGVGGGA